MDKPRPTTCGDCKHFELFFPISCALMASPQYGKPTSEHTLACDIAEYPDIIIEGMEE